MFFVKILFWFLLLTNIQTKDGCKVNSDCQTLHYCDLDTSYCVHKKLFPMTSREILGVCVVGLVLGIANGGGIGGGPIIVPILQSIFLYDLKQSIYIGFITILAGALGNYLRFSFIRNDINNGPIINYDLLLINVPMLTCGALIGVILNQLLPESIICFILIIILLISLQKTYKRYKSQIRKEKQQQNVQKNQELEDLNQDQTNEKLNLNQSQNKLDLSFQESDTIKQFSQSEKIYPLQRTSMIKAEQNLFPKAKISFSLFLLFGSCLLILLRGSKYYDSLIGVAYCGANYWILNGAQIIFTIAFELILYKYLSNKQKRIEKYELSLEINNQEFKQMPKLIRSGFYAGFFGGICGLGGGTILTPIWLSLQYQPQVVTATSVACVIFSAFSSSFSVIYYGFVDVHECAFFFGISFVCSFIIAFTLRKIIEKTGRESILILILIFKIVISLAVLPTVTIYQQIKQNKSLFEFHQVC